jgi:hypothetical protein
MKSFADYSKFDRTTPEGLRALGEQLTDDLVPMWEVFEAALRDPRAVQRQRLDGAVIHNLFASAFLDTAEGGAPIVKPVLNEFGPLAVLAMQLCAFLASTRLHHIFTALDAVREARDRRRHGISPAVVPQSSTAVVAKPDDDIVDVVDENAQPALRRSGFTEETIPTRTVRRSSELKESLRHALAESKQ